MVRPIVVSLLGRLGLFKAMTDVHENSHSSMVRATTATQVSPALYDRMEGGSCP